MYETNGTYAVLFTYDYDGTLISFNYDANVLDAVNGTEYFYIRYQLGDITHLVDSTGVVRVHYLYDAYGTITYQTPSQSIGEINPYRYRGYRYDDELSWYYLNSSYYTPEVGRFLNSDDIFGTMSSVLSNNVFAYSQNNPIMFSDTSGHWPKISNMFAIIAIAAATIAVVAVMVVLAPVAVPALATTAGVAMGGTAFGATVMAVGLDAAYIAATATVLWAASVITEYNGEYGTLETEGTHDVEYPGDDPNNPPGEDYEWRGKGDPNSGQGNWYNDKTGEWYHPDIDHGDPIGPHWDYGQHGVPGEWRIFPDGTVLPK